MLQTQDFAARTGYATLAKPAAKPASAKLLIRRRTKGPLPYNFMQRVEQSGTKVAIFEPRFKT
jgi:hypothetical protein